MTSLERIDPEVRLHNLAQLADDTPELVIDLAVAQTNIDRAAALARRAGKNLRPHIKTHKLPELARRQIRASEAGIQTAKLGEAETMAEGGITDILIGYPLVGQKKLERLTRLARQVEITVALDNYEIALAIDSAARHARVSLSALIEIDTGLRRTGVATPAAAAELAQKFSELRHLRFRGFFTHEGHIYTHATNDEARRQLTRQACSVVEEAADETRSHSVPVEIVSVGSSATFRYALDHDAVTEVRPGTYVLNDLTQLAQGAANQEDVAAVVAATIVSRPRSDEVVIDSGSKSLTSDRPIVPAAPATYGRIALYGGCDVVRLSEEHAVAKVPHDSGLRIGDRVAVIPNHICPVVNLFDAVTVRVDDGSVVRWAVAARGRSQ